MKQETAILNVSHQSKSTVISIISLLLLIWAAIALILISGCDSEQARIINSPTGTPDLSVSDVQTLLAQAIDAAEQIGAAVTVAVVDREANVLGVFRMTGTTDANVFDTTFGAIAKARTAAYLSSNQHAFSTLTACYITRPHFPPGVENAPGGPLYGVPYSSIGDGDIMPNGDIAAAKPALGAPGLTGVPGGIPIFKDGRLAGGIGISGGELNLSFVTCQGTSQDEQIALAAVGGYRVADELRGDRIFIDGILFLYANAEDPQLNFNLTFADLASRGIVDAQFPIRATPTQKFAIEGEVNLDPAFDFRIKDGSILTAQEVKQIIDQAVVQANKTRAAIRRPLGSAARVFVTVCDVDGTILGIWRTPDATLFSFDVSAQKARTVVAYSRTNHPLGLYIRSILGLPTFRPLSVTCRALGFMSQDFYPPGIDQETQGHEVMPGPLYEGPEFGLQQNMDLNPFGNGITIFPGGVALYMNGAIVGGIGVSGDGVDQDDIISYAGTEGFRPHDSVRCDQFFYDGIRLPYVKFPRRPEIE